MKIVYTQPDGSTAIIIPAPKENIAKSFVFKDDIDEQARILTETAKQQDSEADVMAFVQQRIDEILVKMPGIVYETMTRAEFLALSDIDYTALIRDRDVPPDATNVRIVADHEIPEDRTFRNALKHDLTYDIDKCVEITKDRLRAERAPLLAELDVEYMRRLEQGKPTTDIAAEKQRLRDITTLPKNTMTLDELKALTATKDY